MDDRGRSSSTELPLKLSRRRIIGGTEKFADLQRRLQRRSPATIPFTGVGIEIYGLKSFELGLATAKLMQRGRELDFHTA